MRPFWLAVLAATAQASDTATDTQATITLAPGATPVNNAIIPTAPGQVGVNPVEEDIGDPDIYRGTIQHADSTLITVDAGTTKWLAKHIDYLTETTTQGTTSTVQLSVATAVAIEGAVLVGDITVVLAEGLASSVAQAADAAVQACNAISVKRDLDSRDADSVLSCLLSHGADAYADNGLFSIVNSAEWNSITIDVASTAVPLMKGAFQVAKTQARKAMLAIFMSAVSINLAEAAAVGGAAGIIVGAMVLPKSGFGAPTTPTTTGNGQCPPDTKKNSESPLCPDLDCLGDEDSQLCTEDPNKDCPCLLEYTTDVQPVDDIFNDQQIALIQSIDAFPMPTPPKTIQNADAITINAPTPSPTCGSNGKSAPSVNFDINVPDGKDGVTINLPIANQPGSWSVSFDKTDSISYWEVNYGAVKFMPVTNGNGAPPNGKITWSVPDGDPTVNSILSLNFNNGNIALKATIDGQQTCTPGTPNSGECMSDCEALIPILNSNFTATIDVTNSTDLSKMVDYATGTGNTANNDWWRVASVGKCNLMIGKDASHRGFPDPLPPTQRSDLVNFINDREDYFCYTASPKLVATPPTLFSSFIGYGQICLADSDNYQKCSGQVAPPS